MEPQISEHLSSHSRILAAATKARQAAEAGLNKLHPVTSARRFSTADGLAKPG
jgi:hypothetical protein